MIRKRFLPFFGARRHRAWVQAVIVLGVVTVVTCFLSSRRAECHEFRPATLGLRETGPGIFAVEWSPLTTTSGVRPTLVPVFPETCQREGAVLDCGARGLSGELRILGLEKSAYHVFVQIEWLGGARTVRTLGGSSPSMSLFGTPPGARAADLFPVVREYTLLGIEHILTGIDHLMFVVALVLLVRFNRRLIFTITAFTLAHSITLAAATLGLTHVPQGPVEAAIALSILLVAVECARDEPSLTSRFPWLVAFTFGLLHGFGFAGALSEIGLPPHQTPVALLFFNVGVELGQLAVIALVGVLALAAKRARANTAPWERGVVYAMGTAAAYWSIERGVALFT